MTTPVTQWGDPIAIIDNTKPHWLDEDEPITVRWGSTSDSNSKWSVLDCGRYNWGHFVKSRFPIVAIKLPAEHSYYKKMERLKAAIQAGKKMRGSDSPYVTIMRMTEHEFLTVVCNNQTALRAAQLMGIIRQETLIEKFGREYDFPEENRELVEQVIEWMKENYVPESDLGGRKDEQV